MRLRRSHAICWITTGWLLTAAALHLGLSRPSLAAIEARDLRITPLHELRGHTAPTGIGVSFAPGGGLVAASSEDGTVRVWRTEDGALLRTLPGHIHEARTCAVFSPDGTLLAAPGEDGTVKLWRTDNWSLERAIRGGGSPIAFSPRGDLLAGVGPTRDVANLWDPQTGELVRSIEKHDADTAQASRGTSGGGAIEALAFSPDGRQLATAGAGGAVSLWRVHDGGLLRVVGRHTDTVRCLAFSPDGRELASGGLDRAARVWSLRGGRSRVLTPGSEAVVALAYSPDGELLASGSYGETCLWRVGDGLQLHTLTSQKDWINALVFSPDGRILATASRAERTVALWRVRR